MTPKPRKPKVVRAWAIYDDLGRIVTWWPGPRKNGAFLLLNHPGRTVSRIEVRPVRKAKARR